MLFISTVVYIVVNLKAIHNILAEPNNLLFVVSDVKDTKFESNSQLRIYHLYLWT